MFVRPLGVLTSCEQGIQVEKQWGLADHDVVAGIAHVVHPCWRGWVLVPEQKGGERNARYDNRSQLCCVRV